jgi:glycosyltransferase involved in cell wall biosynthesis
MSIDRAEHDPHAAHPPAATDRVVLDVTVPVFNEQGDLETSVRRLHAHLRAHVPYSFRITIADNASTDATPAIAAALARELAEVTSVRLAEKGRGRALRAVWEASDAQVLAYCDVDLSTDLAALLPLVAPLLSGHSDLAIGSRLAHGARVVRGPKRELISRGYNALLHATLRARFSDAQCGFKAVRREIAEELLPAVRDDEWFFDTELLVLAQRRGLRIHEVPVDWIDDPDSRVKIWRTAADDLLGVGRLLSASPIARFLGIGVASTVAYALLFLLFRGLLGSIGANAVALALTAVANTAANRRLTFGIRGRAQAAQHQVKGLIAFGISFGLTTGALAGLHAATAAPGRSAEVAVLVVANLVATVTRFVLYRSWVFGRRRPSALSPATNDGSLS